ncbi:hypothetical protein PIB30_023419 [Stylosanthes scabra]|uniref:Uncharacterized protein n=1 Tax=Stylosanthes scabra TaxID=79078 RepID=A0ABU6XBA5_9FABA|nr:hypothetical protein [Stylosanthes scabra]
MAMFKGCCNLYSDIYIHISADEVQSAQKLAIQLKVFWRGVVEELLWFISGSTNAKGQPYSEVNNAS